jgi:Leucine-rich repeat (LRR) protein
MYNYSTFKIMVSANTGVGQFTFMSNADTMIFSGNGTFFYTDSAGTLGKSNNINLTKNVSKVIYIRSATAGYINFTKSKITKLVYISVSSEPSVSFDISALTALTYLYLGGSNTCSGSIAALTALTYLVLGGSNTCSGSIAALTALTYLYLGGSNTCSGSIAALTALTYLVLGGPNTCIINSVINETGLCYLDIESIILTQAVVDQILLDFWTNKDLAKSRSERIIKITGKTGSSAPSATGATYVSELAAYRSPHNNSLYNYWTVTTR